MQESNTADTDTLSASNARTARRAWRMTVPRLRHVVVAVMVAALVAAAACSTGSNSPEPAAAIEDPTPDAAGSASEIAAGAVTGAAIEDQAPSTSSDGGSSSRGESAAPAVAVDRCQELVDGLRAQYIDTMDWWIPGHLPSSDGDRFLVGPTSGDSAGALEGVDYSGTNLQEAGVAEADVIYTDGERIFVISFDRLVVIDASEHKVTGAVDLADGDSAGMLVHGDRVLVVRDTRNDRRDHVPHTVIQLIEVDGEVPRIVDTLRVKGEHLGTRSVDGVAWVATTHSLLSGLPFPDEWDTSDSSGARTANREAAQAFTVADWLPTFSYDGAAPAAVSTCEHVVAPESFSGFGTTTVLTVDLDGKLDRASSVTLLAPGDDTYYGSGGIYAASGSIYVTSTNWRGTTAVHRFDTTGDEAAYAASGEVPGYLRSKHALSEHDGYLRVVTTTLEEEAESHLSVLRQSGVNLEEVGAIGGLGLGEQVSAVRFDADTAYVVTARDTDPLHVIDLSDPARPEVVGVLKVPGAARYVHLLDDGAAIGVGRGDGGFSARVSLVDAGDPLNPQETSVWEAPDAWDEVGWRHRAFLWWEPENLAVIPLRVWEGDDDRGEALVLRVDGDRLVEAGRIVHHPGETPPPKSPCRLITPDDLPERTSGEPTSFEEIVGWLTVLACEPGEKGLPHDLYDEWTSKPGFDLACDPSFHVDDTEAEIISQVSTPDESVLYCWSNTYPNLIVRSLVVGDELWTLSYAFGITSGERNGHLEVNDLTTLETVAVLEL